MALPANYSVYGVANNGDQLKLVRSDSTSAAPRFITIDRSPATYDAQKGRYSVSQYRIRIVRGTVDSEGLPKPERVMCDCTFRIPAGEDTQMDTIVSDLNGIIDAAGFLAMVKGSTFPS